MKIKALFLVGLMSWSVIGCVSTDSTALYYWGSYPKQTYLSLTAPEKTSAQQQMAALEKDLEVAKAKNLAVPPGMYAHIGWLNLQLNSPTQAIQYFELERQIYPESKIWMDYLLKNMLPSSAQGMRQ